MTRDSAYGRQQSRSIACSSPDAYDVYNRSNACREYCVAVVKAQRIPIVSDVWIQCSFSPHKQRSDGGCRLSPSKRRNRAMFSEGSYIAPDTGLTTAPRHAPMAINGAQMQVHSAPQHPPPLNRAAASSCFCSDNPFSTACIVGAGFSGGPSQRSLCTHTSLAPWAAARSRCSAPHH